MDEVYLDWLRRHGERLVEGGGIWWRRYRAALVPATTAPCYVDLPRGEAGRLLQASRALMVRYSSDPTPGPSSWWYIVCDRYDPKELSSKTRNEINRGRRNCTVDRLEPEWLADNGYPCYRAAVGRYGTAPVPADVWKKDIRLAIDGPISYWGAFVGGKLAGYARCVSEGNNVATSSIRLDPDHLKDRAAYALVSQVVAHYVGAEGRTMSNGNRAVVHETQFQEFLMKHGFRKQYCRLNVVYRTWLRAAVALAFPLRKAVARRSRLRLLEGAAALLAQEEIRRATR